MHVHPYDGGRETLAAEAVAATLKAMRALVPGVAVLTTSAGIEPDPGRRFRLVAAWPELPDLVTANMGEDGIVPRCDLLLERGVGIEAGLLAPSDAEAFVASGLAPHCARVLIEPLSADEEEALADAEAMEATVVGAGVALEQVHHGDGIASWAVNRRAVARGHGIRTGLEDTVFLPDGRVARDNAELVAAARALLEG